MQNIGIIDNEWGKFMINLNLDYFLDGSKKIKNIFEEYKEPVKEFNKSLEKRKCPGGDMLGWMNYPMDYDKAEIKDLISVSSEWYKNDKIKNIVMLGIGGSYIGIRAAIDMVLPEFNRKKEIHYVSSMSSSYVANLVEKLKKEDFYLIVVSKSGTTLEVGVAFRIFYNLLFEKFGSEGAKEKVVCITDKTNGVLRKIVKTHNLKSYSIPKDVGGRFSAITPVGLFAMGAMGLDVEKILKGCREALEDTKNPDIFKNTAYQYAALRDWEYKHNSKVLEVFCVYEDGMRFVSEHLKQLFAESEGKQHSALYPTNCLFTTDLHSVGQYLQEGKRTFFETCIETKKPLKDITIHPFMNDEDGLGFLNGKTLDQINKVAASSTIEAHHIDGNVDIVKIEMDERNEENFGYFYSWFSKAVAMSGLLLGVNPFDQPGVEAYKKRMFTNLGKK